MSVELYYTSAPRGLKPGSAGYCTVAATEGIGPSLQARLESLSSLPSACADAADNSQQAAAVHAHWRLNEGGRPLSILSRIAPAGLDYSRRPNTLAYHVVLGPAEQPQGGPTWALMQRGIMKAEWTGEPRKLAPRGPILSNDVAPRACKNWEAVTGDAGWGGVLAQACMLRPAHPVYLLYQDELDLLPLLDEAIALLPPMLRWTVTFNTCFTALPAGLSCAIRCIPRESLQAREILKRGSPGPLLDLTRLPGPAPDGPAASAAREGVMLAGPHAHG